MGSGSEFAATEIWSAADKETIMQLVADACAEAPDRLALVFEDGVALTRADYMKRVERFSGYLSTKVEPDARVAIMLPNRVEFLIAWIAVVANRAILVSMNPALREHDAGHILRDSGACLLIADEELRPMLSGLQADCPDLRDVLYVGGEEPGGLDGYAGTHSASIKDSRSLRTDGVNVYYTSGTTGPPKGCLVNHEYWLRYVDLYLRLYGMNADDRILCCLQFYYNDPPWQFLTSLLVGSTLVAVRRFSVSRFWQVVRDYDVTQAFGIASIPMLLLKADPGEAEQAHKVRFGMQVGMPPSIHRACVERWGFPWVEGYGLTETGLVVSMPLDCAEEMTGSGSIGLACPEAVLRIADESDRELPRGELGEIQVATSTPGLMVGYLNAPEATAEMNRGGWVHTGDLGSMDEQGFLYFRGRSKDMVRRSGENVAAPEVEEVLRLHPDILDAAVVPVPDDVRGEEVGAHVRLVPDASPQTVPPEAIVKFCSERLASFKVPRYIGYRSQDFPRTPSMRIRKDELRKEGDGRLSWWDRTDALGW